MGVNDYVQVVRRRWAIVVIATLVGALLGGAYAATEEVQYTSTSQLFVAIADQNGSDPLQAGQAAQQRLVSYASLATGQAVTQGVIDQLNLDETTGDVAGRITVQYPPGTVLLNITTTGDSAAQARELNGAVDDQLQAVVRRLESVPGGGTPGASLSVVDPPSEGTAGGRSSLLMIILGLIAGLVVGTVIALVRDRAKRTIDTPADLMRALDVPVAGPVDAERPTNNGVRLLRTKLLTMIRAEGGPRTVLLTGLAVDTGSIAGALATALMNTGQRVVVVDARSEAVAGSRIRGPGLADILWGRVGVAECLQEQDGGLVVLPGGDLSGTTADLLASDAFGALLGELENSAVLVFVHAGDLAQSPEIVTIAAHPVVAVIAIPLAVADERSVVANTADLIAAANGVVALPVRRQRTPDSLRGRFSRNTPSGARGGRGTATASAPAYPIISAPDGERPGGMANRGGERHRR